jgi:hypothetical protein
MSPTRKETLRKAEEENAKNREKTRKTPVPKYAEGGKVSNFGKAFRAAREAGKKEFTFGGKSYTTKMADAPAKMADAPAKKAAPSPSLSPSPSPSPAKPAAKLSSADQARMNLGLGRAGNSPAAMARFREMQAERGADIAGRGKGTLKGSTEGGGLLSGLRRMMTRSTANRAKEAADKQALKKSQQEFDKRAGDTEVPAMLKKAKGGELKKGGKTMMYAKGGKAMKMAKGGSASKRADGIAKKGKTKAMMPKMAKGGKMKGC